MTRPRPKVPRRWTIRFVPSEAGLPPGDLHPYRGMAPAARENLLVESAVRILRECDSAEAGTAPGDST